MFDDPKTKVMEAPDRYSCWFPSANQQPLGQDRQQNHPCQRSRGESHAADIAFGQCWRTNDPLRSLHRYPEIERGISDVIEELEQPTNPVTQRRGLMNFPANLARRFLCDFGIDR